MSLENLDLQRKVYAHKKKFRIWPIGDPVQLGYWTKEEAESQDYQKRSQEWHDAVCYVTSTVFDSLSEEERKSLPSIHMEWIGGTIYCIESFPMYTQYTKPYIRFDKLVRGKIKVGKSNLATLKEEHILITDLAIPQQKTIERTMFDRAMKTYTRERNQMRERLKEILVGIETVKSKINSWGYY